MAQAIIAGVKDAGLDASIIVGEPFEARRESLKNELGVEAIESNKEAQPISDVTQTEDLYSVAGLPLATVSDLAKRFEEAVVRVNTPRGLGSGFIIHTDGYVITNFHVIEGETEVTLKKMQAIR